MTTVYFYFNFPSTPTDILDTTKYKQTTVSSTRFPCSSDIESDCIKQNLFSNWTVGNASCSFTERCLGGTRCCNAGCPIEGCNKTCKEVQASGIRCKGFNQSTCGCSGNWGSTPVYRTCAYTCYAPPTDTYCFPGAIKTEYVEGNKDINNDSEYTFKATYTITTFTTAAQVKQLEDTLDENSVRLKADYKASNTAQLNKVKQWVCISSNLFTEPCTTYCEPDTTKQLPTSNCTESWNTFCQYQDNIASDPCKKWCAIDANGNTNCKDIYLAYCNNPANFTKPVCKEFYRTQYINNQLSDGVTTLLKTQCAKYADASGNVVDSNGNKVQPGTSSDGYPATTCACFLPDSVYNTFYDNASAKYPDLRSIFNVNQCSYPDCANTIALQPQKMTCPNVAITSCIVNNTVGGNVTNSNFNIVNKCITEVQETGTYTKTNANILSPEKAKTDTQPTAVKAVIPPPERDLSKDPNTAGLGNYIYQSVATVIGMIMAMLCIASLYHWKQKPNEASAIFKYLVPLVVIGLAVLLWFVMKKIR